MANFLDLTTGLPALWAKIKSKFYTKSEVDALIPEDEVVVVTITLSTVDGETVYTADKTYSELREASIAGKNIILKYSIYTFYLWSAPKTSSATTQFVFGTLVGGNEFYFTIDSNNVVSRPTLRSVRSVNGNTGIVSLGISDMNDATISNPINNQILTYDSTSSKWVNSTPESDVMVVNITYDSNSSAFVADKTYTETETAWSAGKIVYAKDDSGHSCVYNGAYFEGTYHDEDFARRIEYYYNYNSNYELDYAEPPIVEQHWIESYYLNKYNTTSYAPTGDYNPATKKYVDDSIPSASTTTPLMDGTASYGSGTSYARANHRHPSDTNKENKAVIVSVTISGSTATVGSPLTAEYMYENFGKRDIYLRDNYRGDIYSLVNYDYDEDEGGVLSVFISKDSSTLGGGDNYTVKVVELGYTDEESDSTWVGDYYEYKNVSISDVLTKTNTTSYTPTADYNPATKKYVDDSIPENELFIVTLTLNGNTYTADKTIAQINEAVTNNKHCIAIQHNSNGITSIYDYVFGTSTYAYFSKGNRLFDGYFNVETIQYDSNGITKIIQQLPTDLIHMSDTAISSPTAGQALIYDSTTSKWVNGSVASDVASLTDTIISSPVDGQVLTYDSTTSKWINSTLSSGVTETRVNELIAAALAQYGDGDTATYGYNDASEVNY